MSFYQPEGDHFLATANTTGPWHPDYQHAGPPSALLGRAFELHADGMQIVRVSVDLLKPIPITLLSIQVEERTPGKRRRVLEAILSDVSSGQILARANALLLRRDDIPMEDLPNHDPEPPTPPADAKPLDFGFFKTEIGYHTSMELKLAGGGIGTGQTQMWMRQRIPLLAEEEPSALQRLLTVADSGNGVSMVADKAKYSFANPDLTVNIRRPASGEWLCLDAMTHFGHHGIGMAESRIWDESGVVANGTQNLLLERNPD